jgi:hypothetical protein
LDQPANTGPADLSFGIAEEDYFYLYQSLVVTYMKRQLSYKADMLNAFSGICQALSAVVDDSFHWGLPSSRFAWGLSWYIMGGGSRNNAICSVRTKMSTVMRVPFPSWSWTAWTGGPSDFWLRWTAGTQERLLGEPEINFYLENTGGEVEPITENTQIHGFADDNSQALIQASKLLDLRNEWKGQPQNISQVPLNDAGNPFGPAHLHFWTSTASIFIRRDMDRPSDPWYTMALGGETDTIIEFSSKVFLETTSHLPFNDPETMKKVPKSYLQHIKDRSMSDFIVKEFVVIGRADWLATTDPFHCQTELSALVVEWYHGVAYRIGVACIDERSWVRLQSRVWKRVVLG